LGCFEFCGLKIGHLATVPAIKIRTAAEVTSTPEPDREFLNINQLPASGVPKFQLK
jgi:hypothetical protein